MPIFILVQSNKNILFCYRDLKTSGYLDVDDQTDLYCLHMVFIPLLNVILTEMMLTVGNRMVPNSDRLGISTSELYWEGIVYVL